MKEMTWEDFYEGFYDWSLSTQKSYSYRLTDYGDAEEVFEIAWEFAFNDEKFAAIFIEKALDAGVRFTPEQVMEMQLTIEKPVLSKMAEHASAPFSKLQLEELYRLIDDDSFERISKKQHTDIFADDEPEKEYHPEPQRKRPGFFSRLFAALACLGSNSASERGGNIGADSASGQRGHNGRCNGDCANCPPHYGYRYGRWYYGHDHVHGCEFGGNRGSGSMD